MYKDIRAENSQFILLIHGVHPQRWMKRSQTLQIRAKMLDVLFKALTKSNHKPPSPLTIMVSPSLLIVRKSP